MSKADLAIRCIFRHPRSNKVYSIEDLCISALRYAGEVVTLADEEHYHKYKTDLFNRLLRRQDEFRSRGLPKWFDVESDSDLLIRWATFDDDKHTQLNTLRSEALPTVLAFLDSLTDREFEFACALACMYTGAPKVHVTPQGGDNDIDVMALIPAYTETPLFCAGKEGLRLVVQAKKYASSVKAEKIKVHLSTVAQIQNRHPNMLHTVPSWFYATRAPIVSWYVAHSGLQGGASSLAKDHGIITSDSLELAHILSNPKRLSFETRPAKVKAHLLHEIGALQALYGK